MTPAADAAAAAADIVDAGVACQIAFGGAVAPRRRRLLIAAKRLAAAAKSATMMAEHRADRIHQQRAANDAGG